MITPTALQNIGYKMYVIFAIFNMWFAITIWFIYPETAGKTLEDIDMEFAKKYGGDDALRELGSSASAMGSDKARVRSAEKESA